MDGEDDIGVPANVLHGDGPGKLVEETADVDGEGGKGHTLGTHLERQNLDGEQGLERGDTDGVDGAEDEDHGERGLRGGVVGTLARRAVRVDATARLCKLGRGNGHAEPDDAAGREGEDEQGASADLVDQQRADNGAQELLARVDQGNVGLLDAVEVSGRLQDGAQEVGYDGVTGPLTKDGDGNVAEETVDGGLVAEQGAVIPPSLVGTVHVEQLLVLVHLERDPGRLGVSVAVILGEHGLGGFLLVVDIEPSGRLGQEKDKEDDQTREEGLEPGDDTPGVVTTDVESTTGSSRGDNGTREPQGVVHGTDGTSERWVVDLDDVHGTGGSSNGHAETEQETTAHEGLGCMRSTLDNGTQDD